MDDAARICARLLREGAVKRRELEELDHLDVRRDVEERLGRVGLVLATSAYSEHVGLRLSPEVSEDPAFDAASNLGLKSDACALLVILWARLVLQKRTAADTRTTPGQKALFSEDQAGKVREYAPKVRFTTLVREFGKVIGSRTHMQRLITQLRRLGFIAGRGEIIEAGPLLELGVDGERMVAFIRRKVLAELLERESSTAAGQEQDGKEDGPDAAILEALNACGGSAGMKDLITATGLRRERILPVLKDLMARKRIRRSGEYAAIRYHLEEA